MRTIVVRPTAAKTNMSLYNYCLLFIYFKSGSPRLLLIRGFQIQKLSLCLSIHIYPTFLISAAWPCYLETLYRKEETAQRAANVFFSVPLILGHKNAENRHFSSCNLLDRITTWSADKYLYYGHFLVVCNILVH